MHFIIRVHYTLSLKKTEEVMVNIDYSCIMECPEHHFLQRKQIPKQAQKVMQSVVCPA